MAIATGNEEVLAGGHALLLALLRLVEVRALEHDDLNVVGVRVERVLGTGTNLVKEPGPCGNSVHVRRPAPPLLVLFEAGPLGLARLR